MSRCVIVLGPYRSGTSLTAQVIETLGVDFGPRSEWISTNRFNPGGYHERGDINAINRKLITSAGRTLGVPGDPESLTHRADRSILEGIAIPWPGHAVIWGMKDPRFCATLKIWIDSGILRSDGIGVIRVIRDPEAIIRSSLEHPSVRRYCRDNAAVARRMVEDYIALADWQVRTSGLSTIRVAYEDLRRDPLGETTRIGEWLGVTDQSKIRRASRLVGKRSALKRYYLRRSLTLPFRAARKVYRLATRAR